MAQIHILKITDKQLNMFTKMFTPAETIEVKAETKPRDQKASGDKAHKQSVVPDIAMATAVIAMTNFHKKQADKGEFIYAKNAHRFIHHGYARVIRVEGRTDSDYVEISTTVTTSRETHNMIYRKTWADWRALWHKYNEKYFKATDKHTVVPAHRTF